MVHTFKCLSRYFMLDVESGSLYCIDELTKDLIDYINTPNEQSKGVLSRYNKKDIDEAQNEINALTIERSLFVNPPKAPETIRENVVKALCLNVSHKCNLRCDYCFADGGSYCGENENMPFSVASTAIDFLIKNSKTRTNLEVDFFGGEPLLNLDVVKKTVDYAKKQADKHHKSFRFTITTNALALNDEAIDFFNKEMYNVVISIDGRKDVHNTVRKTLGGKDSFDVVVENALLFKQKRREAQYYIRGTYTSLNKDFSKDVLFLNDLGFTQISIEPVVLDEKHRLSISKNDLGQIFDEYERLAFEYIERRKTQKWFSFFHFNIDLKNGPCEAKRLSACGAGCEYLAVTPNGDIYPCHQFVGNEKHKVGNVLTCEFDKSISDEFASCNVSKKPDCVGCFAKYYCGGGCAANAVNHSGSILKPHFISCEIMRKRLECALAVYAIENID